MKKKSGDMKMGRKFLMANLASVCFAGLSFGQITHSQEPPIFDESRMILAGTGCDSSDSLSYVTGAEGTVLSLSFARFGAETGPRQLADRKSCTVRLPVTIPAGHQLIVTEGSPNGSADLAEGQSLSVASRLSIFGNGSPVSNRVITGPGQAEFGPAVDAPEGSSIFDSPRRVIANCAAHRQTGFLGLNLAMSTQSDGAVSSAQITDVQIGLQLVPCP